MTWISDVSSSVVEELLGPTLKSLKRIVVGLMLLILCIASNQDIFLIRVIVAITMALFYAVFGTWGRAISNNVVDTLLNLETLYVNATKAACIISAFAATIPLIQLIFLGTIAGHTLALYFFTLPKNVNWDLDIMIRLGQLFGGCATVISKNISKCLLSWVAGFSLISGLNCFLNGGYCSKLLCTFEKSFCSDLISDRNVLIMQVLIPLVSYVIFSVK